MAAVTTSLPSLAEGQPKLPAQEVSKYLSLGWKCGSFSSSSVKSGAVSAVVAETCERRGSWSGRCEEGSSVQASDARVGLCCVRQKLVSY